MIAFERARFLTAARWALRPVPALVLSVAMLGCPGRLPNQGPECTPGSEGCECTTELNCEAGLVCMDSICVPESTESDSTTESQGAESGDGSGTDDGETESGGDGDGDGGSSETELVEIPGGMFTDFGDGPNESHEIAAFRLERYEVTVEAYTSCISAGMCTVPADTGNCNWHLDDRDAHPMNCIDWQMASDYCAWVGRRLPTEWEWEWAARGRDDERSYPWGEEAPSCDLCVMHEQQVGCGTNSTIVGGSRSPQGDSRDGVVDMAGNVMEWTDSWENELEQGRVLRGGAYWTNDPAMLSTEYRYVLPAEESTFFMGVRCAADL